MRYGKQMRKHGEDEVVATARLDERQVNAVRESRVRVRER